MLAVFLPGADGCSLLTVDAALCVLMSVLMCFYTRSEMCQTLMTCSCALTGRGGRVAAHGGTLSSFIVKNIALDKTDDSNPREAILRHAKDASENPYWVAPAYKQ